jgi:hypothetical protein
VKKLKTLAQIRVVNDMTDCNLNLIKAPENVVDYIALHKLCHLKIKGPQVNCRNIWIPNIEILIISLCIINIPQYQL